MNKNKIIYSLLCAWLFVNSAYAQKKYDSYKGLLMTGYQGWFNAPSDGAGRGWYHYKKGGEGFKPGSTSVDFWPDTKEYTKRYQTAFSHKDGSPAYTFSSYDYSTVNLHFKWMKEYGIDGAFMQRFVSEIKGESGRKHFDKVLDNALKSAAEYDRSIVVMYDLSGMKSGDEKLLLADLDRLDKTYDFAKRQKAPTYLFHNGKPLVSIWGIGFNDDRAYGLPDAEKLIDGLRARGYSIMIGVPTYWRELKSDTESNPKLHELIKKCDVLLPWFVGRYKEESYEAFAAKLIPGDIAWCKANGIDYVPLCFPGFSWENLKGESSAYIDRNAGKFLWKQLAGGIGYGAEMLYVAMFDEIDEGTAIFKTARRSEVPRNGDGKFEGIEDNLDNDYYLWLTGEAGKMLRKERVFTKEIPSRKK
ncbi:glycoside hydrolase family 71/99-like protein [Sphingobacterium corticibacterium]|uniref:Xylosidase n=1 Tax=Sphingobacterium corticibacterium TaxID=2484746 RepID=A0A4Q6XPJ8_9SPHI|nr:glycoside hydrolase family 71/99-like protein [Sphingobacterium corticibacterium]RZF62140.1 xylosidase [Sphingobacterium corticibacterium]